MLKSRSGFVWIDMPKKKTKKTKTTKDAEVRRQWTLEEKHRILRELKASGKDVKVFAEDCGVSSASLYAWMRAKRDGKLPKPAAAAAAKRQGKPGPKPGRKPGPKPGPKTKASKVSKVSANGASAEPQIEDVLRTVARAGNRLGCLAVDLSSNGVGYTMQAAGLAFEAGRLDLASHLLDEAAGKTAGVAASASIEQCKQDVTRAANAVSALRERMAS